MENELGFSVLTRSKAGVSLTNYGEQLLPYVNAVLNCDESLKQEIAELNGLKQGKVKIGVFSSVCTSWLPEILHSFKKKYTEIDIEVFQGTYDDVVYWIKNGVVDLGFLSVSSAKDIPIEPLYRDELLCVLPSGTKEIKVQIILILKNEASSICNTTRQYRCRYPEFLKREFAASTIELSCS